MLPRYGPLLVLVSGAPASGKSTLADQIATAIGMPLLSKDLIKEALFESLGAPNRQRSVELSIASYKVLYAVLGRLVESGVDVIVDCNFKRGESEKELRPLLDKSRGILIHCWTTREEIARRYDRRAATRERHPGHHDEASRPVVLAQIDAGVYEPLDLDIPTLEVETTEGSGSDLSAIRAFVESAGGNSRARPAGNA